MSEIFLFTSDGIKITWEGIGMFMHKKYPTSSALDEVGLPIRYGFEPLRHAWRIV
jgi:hypothetical protein